jgi:hypothetical protein
MVDSSATISPCVHAQHTATTTRVSSVGRPPADPTAGSIPYGPPATAAKDTTATPRAPRVLRLWLPPVVGEGGGPSTPAKDTYVAIRAKGDEYFRVEG